MDFTTFLEFYILFRENLMFYGTLTIIIHTFCLCIVILVITYYEDLTVPIFIFCHELGICLENYNNFKNSYKYFFIYMIIISIIIAYYSIIYFVKRNSEHKIKNQNAIMEENYKNQNIERSYNL